MKTLDTADSVAIVGARPTGVGSQWLIRNLRQYGFSGEVWPVSPKLTDFYGLKVYPSVEELPWAPSIAVLAVNPVETIRLSGLLSGEGTKAVVIYSDGFAETGTEEGRRLARDLDDAVDGRLWLLGPGSLGFADFSSGLCALSPPVPDDIRPGDVSMISHSGALLSSLLGGASEEDLGVDWCVSVGSAASYGLADALSDAIERNSTRTICAYVEGLGSSDEITRVGSLLDAARGQGTRVIVAKSGSSAVGARVALSHTGSIAGDNRLVDAFFEEHDVIRVPDTEEMLRLAKLLSIGSARRKRRSPVSEGLAIIENSGGATALAADLAARNGVALASFEDATLDALKRVGGASSHVSNPVDLTAALHDPAEIDDIYRKVQMDPGVGFVLVPWSVTLPDDLGAREHHQLSLGRHVRLAGETGVPLIVCAVTTQAWTDWVRQLRRDAEPNVAIVQGLGLTMRSLRFVMPENKREADTASSSESVIEEARALSVLGNLGVPVPRTKLVGRQELDVDELIRAAGMTPPFVVKVAADGLSHKAALGGVEVGVGIGEIARAVSLVTTRVASAGIESSRIQGSLVAEMHFGPELMIGLSRDDSFGDYLIIGWGGVLTEAIGGHVVRLLGDDPATRAQTVEQSVGEVVGVRTDGAVVRKVAEALWPLVEAFCAGELRNCRTVEVNPLIVDARGPVAADALIVTDKLLPAEGQEGG
jgi:acyl-CoA synthetase (NDP forming)